jgi:hypothetical protein
MTGTVKVVARTLIAALVLLGLSAPVAHAGTRVFIQIGAPVPVAPPIVAPVVVPPPPVYGTVWRPGYYSWAGYGYVWVPGAWVRPPYARALWVAPRWVARPRGGFWVRGYWRR